MKGKLLPLLILLLPSASALAGKCEDNFTKSGNPLKGTEYSTSVTVPGLSVASAVGQMNNIAVSDGMNVIDANSESGSLLLEVAPNLAHRGLQVYVTAVADGTVSMLMKTRRGALANADSIKTSMCKMLYQLKPGKAPPKAAGGGAKPISISAIKLADEVSKTVQDNVAMIDVRNKGKTYRVSGYFLGSESGSGGLSVFYDMKPSLLPGFIPSSRDAIVFTRVMCHMASDQRGYSMTLRKGDKLDLIGTFDSYQADTRLIHLGNCRAAK
ncbi:hypothetical protein [Lysobacter sp. 1R34A]|uniref:hypothetical protein n=1 Tax=Lysobacter sp. 1R34A TaxID=3445786 RepID=UPI003EEAB430